FQPLPQQQVSKTIGNANLLASSLETCHHGDLSKPDKSPIPVPVSCHKTGGTTPGNSSCINSATQQFEQYVVRMAKIGPRRSRRDSSEADPAAARNIPKSKHRNRNHKDAKPDPPTPKSLSVIPTADPMGPGSDLEPSPPASSPRRPTVANTGP